MLPSLLTPGAAENIAVKTFRLVKIDSQSAAGALSRVLAGYKAPVAESIVREQIRLAVEESSDPSFVPAEFR